MTTFLLHSMGWKTVIIGAECVTTISLGRLKVKIGDDYQLIPITDIDTIIFSHYKVTITIPLLSELIKNNKNIIICDEKNDPIGVFQPFNSHSLVFKQLEEQINWKITRKKKLWRMIVEKKIQSEIDCLNLLGLGGGETEVLEQYRDTVYNDDSTNREGSSARIYFKKIFGKNFSRDSDNEVNHALNYGYKILASYISKCIVSRGLITQLGIHHIGESNPFNLTYDFMETLRVVVDSWVYLNVKDDFNSILKKDLIELLNRKVYINEKWFRLNDAIEDIIDSYIAFLNEERNNVFFVDISKGIRNED